HWATSSASSTLSLHDALPIVIQRHGAAFLRSKWRKGEDTRPLNKKGRKQARALPPLLDAFDPSSVLSSPWERCRATVKPLATVRSEEHTSELQSRFDLVCRLL